MTTEWQKPAPIPGPEESSPNRSLLKRIPPSERPRERLLRSGGSALSDAEVVAVLLRVGRPGLSALEMAQEVLDERGGLAGLLTAGLSSLRRSGLGEAKAAAVLAAVELGRRLARAQIHRGDDLDNPVAVAEYLMLRYPPGDQEVMGALYLDVRNRLVGEGDIYRGTMSRAAVEPRAILKAGLLSSASALILFHTHPSGDPAPSLEDLEFTRRLADAGKLLGIRLVDHVILGRGGRWVSLKRRGGW